MINDQEVWSHRSIAALFNVIASGHDPEAQILAFAVLASRKMNGGRQKLSILSSMNPWTKYMDVRLQLILVCFRSNPKLHIGLGYKFLYI